jgi:WD40 repeat protein
VKRWLTCQGPFDAVQDLWDVATGRERRRFAGHRGGVNVVAFTPDGRSVVSGSEDGTGLIWDVSDVRGKPPGDAPLARESLRVRWEELAGADARVAHRATWALSAPAAVAFLGEHLRPARSPDAQGIPAPSGPIAPPGILRTLRAIAALERAGTPEARAVLARMARGDPGAIETREAKAARDRLDHREEVR